MHIDFGKALEETQGVLPTAQEGNAQGGRIENLRYEIGKWPFSGFLEWSEHFWPNAPPLSPGLNAGALECLPRASHALKCQPGAVPLASHLLDIG